MSLCLCFYVCLSPLSFYVLVCLFFSFLSTLLGLIDVGKIKLKCALCVCVCVCVCVYVCVCVCVCVCVFVLYNFTYISLH